MVLVKKEITVFTPVIGKKYWDLFLDFSLPSLLASGNVPSLEAQWKVRLCIVTSVDEWEKYKGREILKQVLRSFAVDIWFIEDFGIKPSVLSDNGGRRMKSGLNFLEQRVMPALRGGGC